MPEHPEVVRARARAAGGGGKNNRGILHCARTFAMSSGDATEAAASTSSMSSGKPLKSSSSADPKPPKSESGSC